jgi:hypothetical protein
VRTAAGESIGRFRQYIKPGRGRPRKDGQPKISDRVVLADAPAPAADPAGQNVDRPAPGGMDDAAIIKESIKESVAAAFDILDQQLAARADMVAHDPTFTAALMKRTAATEVQRQSFVRLGDLLIAKCEMRPEWLPWIAAGTVSGLVTIRYALAFGGLARMQKQIAEKSAQKLDKLAPQ